jgi:hypothetical protein
LEAVGVAVERKLKSELAASPDLDSVLALWHSVDAWNREGGKDAIEEGLKEASKRIVAKAKDDLEKLRSLLKGVD